MPIISVFCSGDKDRKVASSRPACAVPEREGEEKEKSSRRKREKLSREEMQKEGIHKMRKINLVPYI